MNSTPTTSFGIGCEILAEFEDDASGFVPTKPNFVSVPYVGSPQPAFVPPTAENLAAAKQFWLPVIAGLTEPVPAKKERLRVRDSELPNCGEIRVESASHPARRALRLGQEISVSNESCLTLFCYEEFAAQCGKGDWVRSELAVPIPWTDIGNIQFEVRRPVKVVSHAEAKT
mgnify:CR=1 FL=1